MTTEAQDKIIADWVAALRSGDYKQGKSYLSYQGKFCCLGVLCDLAVNMGVDVDVDANVCDEVYYDGKEDLPPEAIWKWVGLTDQGGSSECGQLFQLNDDGLTFSEIADLIESRPAGLFVEVAQ